ncbi:hypothetical protein [Streptomyces sp. AS02]|uniref:hypothetical protein n=1 Tax=Streptomyces sp. AS02 TaxID=2938946 RepID=UPI0020214134|nr:hypothetical protein [Streptomyces sp. AS02]MCL8011894.1 hypothetical protein [Streptomyces sp. AS02]
MAFSVGAAVGCSSPVDCSWPPVDRAESDDRVGADSTLLSLLSPDESGLLTRIVMRMPTTGMTIPTTHQAQRGC